MYSTAKSLGLILILFLILCFFQFKRIENKNTYSLPNIIDNISPQVDCLKYKVDCNSNNDCNDLCKNNLKNKFKCLNGKCNSNTKSTDQGLVLSLKDKCQRLNGGYLLLSSNRIGGLINYKCTCLNPMYYNGKYCNEKVISTCENGNLEMVYENHHTDKVGSIIIHAQCSCPPQTIKCTPIYLDSFVIRPMCLNVNLFNILKKMNIVKKLE
jgi:Per os infectivity factor 3